MKPKRSIQIYYTFLQVFYWLAVGFSFSYASVYLHSRGVSNTQIGLVLASAYVLSAMLQPVIAAVIDRWEIPLAKGVVVIYGLATVLAVMLYAMPMPNILVLVVLVLVFSMINALQPSIISLSRVLEIINRPVNFGVARGIGSLVYAVVMTITGQVLQKVSPLFLPLTYAAVMAASFVLLIVFRPIMSGRLQIRTASIGGFPSVREYPLFWIFLGSVLCLSIGEGFYNAFMLQMMQRVGGDNGSVGITMGVCAAIEFPAMLLYSRLSRKFGVNRLLLVAGWSWMLKALLIYLAGSPMGIYAAYLLQCACYAMYIPGSIEFVSNTLPENSFLKGQSLTVSAYTVGGVVTSFFGGMLLDSIGIQITLGLVAGIMALGAVLMSVATMQKKKSKNPA